MVVAVVAAASMMVAFGAVRADAASIAVVAGPGSAKAARYATPVVVMQPGDDLTLANADASWHGLVSQDIGPDDSAWCGLLDPDRPEGPANPRQYRLGQCPLFVAPLAQPLGGTSAVLGVDRLEPGRVYAFSCPIVAGMSGNVIVAPVVPAEARS